MSIWAERGAREVANSAPKTCNHPETCLASNLVAVKRAVLIKPQATISEVTMELDCQMRRFLLQQIMLQDAHAGHSLVDDEHCRAELRRRDENLEALGRTELECRR